MDGGQRGEEHAPHFGEEGPNPGLLARPPRSRMRHWGLAGGGIQGGLILIYEQPDLENMRARTIAIMESNKTTSSFSIFLMALLPVLLVSSLAILSDATSLINFAKRATISSHENLGKPMFLNTRFNTINRRHILSCPDPNPFLAMSLDNAGTLADIQEVTLTVSGVLAPSDTDWIGVFSAASNNYSDCPANKALYLETGDTASLPLLCDYPIKSKFLSDDPSYLSCSTLTCSASLTFRLINIRTPITFVFYTGGFDTPCILLTSDPIQFANPSSPLYGHLSSIDSTGTTMRLTWVSGDSQPQLIQYGGGQTATSAVSSFSSTDMCASVPAPAPDFGWHDPGFIHSAIMTGLSPSTTYTYNYGSDSVGWSGVRSLITPPAAGGNSLNWIMYGDMGKADRDTSIVHYIQPGSLGVIDAVTQEINAGNANLILHIGDISYATGFLAEWDFFLEMIGPVASKVPYMTAIGNHERDFPGSGSYYVTTDSGGECGVAYETYFQMPASSFDKPWYSISLGPVHITVLSTEHDWTVGSEQYNWLNNDLAGVDRSQTPWLVVAGHRPQYASTTNDIISEVLPPVDPDFVAAIEPLLFQHQVDLALWGHVHFYERTCAVYQAQCYAFPTKDSSGIDTYSSTPYTAPVHAVIGMAGFKLDGFDQNPSNWSLVRLSDFGYILLEADIQRLFVQYNWTVPAIEAAQIRHQYQLADQYSLANMYKSA
ncbi:hypothetical protein O6H91_03G083700 [Diphasiastrum complanatum]|uniref:Uncharacterized protein n=1 Tax=Diphasiastrum complanatum TaxID=34168 RepID=A0ACC2E8F0_DIPCM|nr:hypothetical protein O6H91_03G083700 [Diphasiastrum complanatum]